MFQLKLTTKNVDIRSSSGLVQNGWISLTIDKGSMIVYISRDKNRIFWVGQTTGHSAKMTITFDDNKQMISINKTNKITFHNAKDPIKYITDMRNFVDKNRKSMPDETQLQNIIDEIAQLIDSTLYRLSLK
jgi:hypothetical protein